MRLLVVDPSRIEREVTLRLLPPDTYEVHVAQDAATALRFIDDRNVDVALIESTMIGVSGAEIVRRLRAREVGTHCYVVMTSARAVPNDLKTAFLAGADDFIRKPLPRDELVARLEGPTRIRRWASRLLGTDGAGAEIARTKAWSTLEASVCTELSEMLGVSLTSTPASWPLDGAVSVAVLPLSLAAESAEVSIAVGLDAASARALAETMLGTPSPDSAAVEDMTREIANVAGGVFRRLAASEGRAFTTGIPTQVAAASFRRADAKARRQWVGKGKSGPVQVRFEVELRIRERRRLRLSTLEEGMVVACPVTNLAGALLLPPGTRITQVALSGLRRALGNDAFVEVLEAG